MNGRRLFREYAQYRGREAAEFIEIQSGQYGDPDILITNDNSHNQERTAIDYRDMVHWIIRTK